jgi:hypothetical protein
MTIDNERLCLFEGQKWHKRSEINPDYASSADYRERLWEYLMGQEEMWAAFKTAILTAKIGEPYDTDLIVYLFSFIDGVPRWVSLLSEWLGMDSTVERFGWVECPECHNTDYQCGYCQGRGKVLSEWAKCVKEAK